MPKNAYFLEKGCKIRSAPEPPLASGGWRPRLQTPALLLLLTDTNLSKVRFYRKTILLL